MSAASFTASRRLRAAFATSACATLFSFWHKPRITYLDAPSSAKWDRSSSLVSDAQKAHRIHEVSYKQQKLKEHAKKGDAELIDHTNDTDTYAPAFEDDDDRAWAQFSRNFGNVLEGASRIQWSGIGDKISDFMLPSWAKYLPDGIHKLQFELSMEPGTLADEIWQEAHDPYINPEIRWNARVRTGSDLCDDELKFREKRKQYMVGAFSKYLDLKEEALPEDIPTIAMCGSGGGLRALVAGTSSYLCAANAGLFDCVTYTAGVSGSCWLQTLFYSSLAKQNHQNLLDHIKSRINTHIAFPPPALKLVTSAPTNKFILSGFIEKLKGDPGATFGLVDVYSLMLAARLMVPKGDLDVKDYDLKLSNQRHYIEEGQFPLPIYTVVRHEIPVEEEKEKEKPVTPNQHAKVKEKARKEAWFQWLELHPWEIWCEEFGAGIPTWSLGRPFENGTNKVLDTGIALPEIRQSLLLGIYGSAFCATLSHYYKEIRPVVSGVAGFGELDGLLEGKNDDLAKIHPIEPATIPNFVYGMKDKLPASCPESVFQSDHLQVMDAGMSNNLPIYPLLRPGRDVDILIAFDASAEVQKENWLSVVDGYARQRGIKTWPIGTGWPAKSSDPSEDLEALQDAEAQNTDDAQAKLAAAQDANKKKPNRSSGNISTALHKEREHNDLDHCNIWVGVKQEREAIEEPPPSKRLSWENPEDTSFTLMQPDATMTIIYFPLLPNDKVPGVHPDKTDFLSTWNFIYTPEQVDKVVELARSNFQEGEEATKRTIRAVYERKKAERLKRQEETRIKWWKRKLRESADAFTGP